MESKRESTPEGRVFKRWKSFESLFNFDEFDECKVSSFSPRSVRGLSESSIEICYIYDSDSRTSSDDGKPSMEDSGIYDKTCHLDVLQSLEMKIDKLTDIIEEQTRQLSVLQTGTGAPAEAPAAGAAAAVQRHAQIVADTIATVLTQRLELPLEEQRSSMLESGSALGQDAVSNVHAGAKALLDALENQKMSNVDKFIRTALTEFLQSEELRDLMVSSTTNSLQSLIRECFTADVTSSYLPLLERSQKRLLRKVTGHLDEAFREIESHSSSFSKSTYKTARFIRQSLERHQRHLEATTAPEIIMGQIRNNVSGIIEQELKQWRSQVLDVIKDTPKTPSTTPPLPLVIPISPPQPIEPGRSAIDQLMSAAEINNKMKDGDMNGSFERALSAADLALVMAACRAADPARVFASPCQLKQHVLLSLIQQLATDMVHDTQLKCRYLEDSIMNLNVEDPVISKHLKAVIDDVCNHLTLFLKNYQSHMSSRRIKMLIMAAGSLVNKEQHAFNHPISNTYVS